MGSRHPDKWGPVAWRKFHIKALTYLANPCACDMKKVEYFYTTTFPQYILCDSCTKHYNRIIQENPIDSRTMITLFQWTVDVHNRVNRKLNIRPVSYAEAFDYWLGKVNESYPNAGFFCQGICNPFDGDYPISY